MITNKVFLGGTCADSTWREDLIPLLTVKYFNPVVDDWNESCQVEEEQQKANDCNIHLYVITSEMIGVFSIAEAIESAMTKNKRTLFVVFPEDFNDQQLKSFSAICNMVRNHGGIAFIDSDIRRVATVLNSYWEKD